MPKAISYIRFSTGKQSTGSSHERQELAVTRWLVQHPDYTLSPLTFADLGKSGYHGDHIKQGGNFAKLLAAVEAKAIKPGDVILVEAIDRTGRMHTADMLADLILPILRSGVSIITLDDNNEYTKDSINAPEMHLLVARLQAAHFYSKQLSERVAASYEIRREKARSGKRIKRFAVTWLTTDGQVKPQYRQAVKQVFDLYISGVGKNAIATRIRASGVPELAKISGPTIDNWLKNRAAIGYWNDIPNACESVVSPEVFMQAQKRQKEMQTGPRTRTSKNFLVGLVKCAVCGANYIIHNKWGKPNNMRCLTHHRLKDVGCTNSKTIPYQVVHFIYLSSAPSWINKALKVIQLTDNDKRKLILFAEREEMTASIQRLVRLLAVAESPELEAQYRLATERRTAIDNELDVLNRKLDYVVESNPNSIFFEYKARQEHDELSIRDPVQLTSLLKQAGYSITVHPGKKLKLADSDIAFIYAGVYRQANTTLGYRIQHGDYEHVISNTMPEVIDVSVYDNDPIGELKYLADRSYKHVRPIKSLKTGLGIKLMVV